MTMVLEGIRVLDITDGVAGPFTTTLLGYLGAEVIRPESRRHLGFRETSNVLKPGEPPKPDVTLAVSPGFARYNFDKLSTIINLTKPEGRDLFKRLVRISDVVVDNLSFGTMQRWGFDYQSLREVKKDIIYASLPSLGAGFHENWTTWGMNLLAFTAFAHNWGHPDTPEIHRSSSSTYGDYIAAMEATASIIAALIHREKTGEGQYIEVAQAESTAAVLGVLYLDYFVNKRSPPPRGNRHPQFAPHNCYRCKGDDRWCVIAISSEDEWEQFRYALESPPWANDAKFRTMADRLKNVEELDKNIETWTKERTPHQVMRILQSRGLAAGAVQNTEDTYHDLQLRAWGHMLDFDLGEGRKITLDGPPFHLSAGQKTTTDRAPFLGEQNDYIYYQLLGLTREEVERLTKNQVLY